MNIIKRIFSVSKKMIVDERYRTKIVAKHGGYKHLSDEDFLKKMYYARMGKRLDLNNPQTYWSLS